MTDSAPEPKISTAPLLDTCPKCGAETEKGFGLAGGGYGVYAYCVTEGCDYFAKMQIDE
jgi:hypothetical protein